MIDNYTHFKLLIRNIGVFVGNYIENNLARDEQIIIKAEVSWLSQFWYLLFGGLLTLGGLSKIFIENSSASFGLVIGIFLIAVAMINVLTTELALTNRRIIAKTGLIRRSTIELKVTRVESLEINQSILGRIFDFGSVIVKGTGGSSAPIPFINRPLHFREQVNNYLDELDDQQKAS